MAKNKINLYLGSMCLAGSLLTLVFQAQLGALIGEWIFAVWLILGGVGVQLLFKARDENDPLDPLE